MLFKSRQNSKLNELSGWPARIYALVFLGVAINTWIKSLVCQFLPKRRYSDYSFDLARRSTALSEPLRVLVVNSTDFGHGLNFLTSQNNVLIADFASNGQEALEACRKVSYDLMLMDLQCSEREEIAEIRRDSTDRQIRIIGVTGQNQLDEIAWKARGMDDYIRKPLNTSEVRKQLHIKMKMKLESSEMLSKPSYRHSK